MLCILKPVTKNTWKYKKSKKWLEEMVFGLRPNSFKKEDNKKM